MKARPPIDVVVSAAANGIPPRVRVAAYGAPSVALSQGDRVRLFSLSTKPDALESSPAAHGEFDRMRVQAFKRAIRDGKLAIDPRAIADRMLAVAVDPIAKKP